MRSRGLFSRARGDVIALAPPLVTTDEQIDRIVEIVGESIETATASIRG
jgi:adenosylmethionine-8-amino-7-oxononanoate aminotransferase